MVNQELAKMFFNMIYKANFVSINYLSNYIVFVDLHIRLYGLIKGDVIQNLILLP